MSGSTEAHIREDSQQFLQAVENCDSDALRHTVFVIRGRCSRLGQVVKADVGDNPERYGRDQLHQIEAAMKQLRERCKSSDSVSLLSSSFPFLSLFSPSFLYLLLLLLLTLLHLSCTLYRLTTVFLLHAITRTHHTALSWFYDLASKATDTLHSSHGSKRVNTQALGEALQKVSSPC